MAKKEKWGVARTSQGQSFDAGAGYSGPVGSETDKAGKPDKLGRDGTSAILLADASAGTGGASQAGYAPPDGASFDTPVGYADAQDPWRVRRSSALLMS